MAKQIGIRQGMETVGKLITLVDWSSVDPDVIQAAIDRPEETGRHFTRFLQNGCRVLVEEPRVLQIDRSTLFNPAEFIGQGWSVWRGPADGKGLEGKEERDARSATLTELDLSQIQLVTMLKPRESVTTGEERIKRLKADGRLRLDENAFKAFWENREVLPARFKERVNGNIQFIFFDGVVLRGPSGHRCTLCVYFHDDGVWIWDVRWLDHGRCASPLSAVLASQN